MKPVHISVLAAAGLIVLAFAGVFQPASARGSAADATTGGMTVLGTGSVTVTPDRASFTFGTSSQSPTAVAALSASSDAVSRIIAALRRVGVSRSDIQTSAVSVAPRSNANGETIAGYTASNSVTVTLRNLAKAGTVIDAAVAAGANQVSGPNLLASDQSSAYRDALKAAFADAREKAQSLAAAADVTPGKITAISEGSAAPVLLAANAATKDSSLPIEPGTQKIEATVSVTFALG